MRINVKTVIIVASLAAQLACNTAPGDTGSEISTSVVSGALYNSAGATVAMFEPHQHKSMLGQVWDAVNPIREARAASWMCSGGHLDPAFAGPGSYAWTPISCSVDWRTGKSASVEWSSTFTVDYGSSCDDKHPWIDLQTGSCSVTRTTGAEGNTQTLTGPNGNSYSVTHNTNGAGTGWDSAVSPAPNDSGLVLACADSGCSTRTLVINGSHLTGTVESASGTSSTKWDHTVTSSGLTVTGIGIGRVVTGAVTVQHNLAKYVSTTTFKDVGYGEAACCFPTTGSVITTYSGGSVDGKSESISFTAACGEASLTTTSGTTESITLQHCI